jgi:uncharacterized Zn-binding protein involved in type VI secretion
MWIIDGEEVIVLGDRTTHGGEVVTATAKVSLLGKQVACVGDQVTCPRCEGLHTIISGAPRSTAHDKAIARNGDSVSCGAKLISASAAILGVTEQFVTEQFVASETNKSKNRYDEQIQIVDEKTGEPLAKYPFYMKFLTARSFPERRTIGVIARVFTQPRKKHWIYG